MEIFLKVKKQNKKIQLLSFFITFLQLTLPSSDLE